MDGYKDIPLDAHEVRHIAWMAGLWRHVFNLSKDLPVRADFVHPDERWTTNTEWLTRPRSTETCTKPGARRRTAHR